MLSITGTFLDEITHDIPSQNWGPAEWRRDFDVMKAIGIDTVILIRAGYQQYATFPSKVLREKVRTFPVYQDLVDLFLSEAERCGITFYFGTYDSGNYWQNGNYEKEVEINLAFCDEFMEKYGHRNAFGGWYISHEISVYNNGMMKVYETLANHLRKLKPVPILISPYIKGVKQFGLEAISLEQHQKEWASVFARLEGLVDIVAFQDGNVPLEVLGDYLEINKKLADRHHIRSWSNVESFDRDMPIKFPPIDFRKLRYKIEQAELSQMEKLITFEFSHFMSPNSNYHSAHHLYRCYQHWLQEKRN
jgi:hypothetical protein